MMFCLLFLLVPVSETAAQTAGKASVDFPLNAYHYGITAHTYRGVGGHFRYSRFIKDDRWRVYDFELVSLKHPKEVKIVNPTFRNPEAYVFGKTNSAYFLRSGYGNKHMISARPGKSGVGLNIGYTGGLNLAVLKPYYIVVVKSDPVTQLEFLATEKYNPEVHVNQADIYGDGGFLNGFDELSLRPGLFGKIYLSFEWGGFSDDSKTLDIGVNVDAFPNALPMMAFINNKAVFTSLYVSFSFGNKK